MRCFTVTNALEGGGHTSPHNDLHALWVIGSLVRETHIRNSDSRDIRCKKDALRSALPWLGLTLLYKTHRVLAKCRLRIFIIQILGNESCQDPSGSDPIVQDPISWDPIHENLFQDIPLVGSNVRAGDEICRPYRQGETRLPRGRC